MEEVKGYVEHIVYRNEDNGYTVFNLNNEDGDLTCVGSFLYIEEGELLRLTGEYVTHALYGLQLAVSSSEVCEPEDLLSIERYLGSGAIRGVGAALAGRIVRRFKEDTFRIIEEEPERLAEVKGISERKAREIAEQVEEKKDMRQAMIYLQMKMPPELKLVIVNPLCCSLSTCSFFMLSRSCTGKIRSRISLSIIPQLPPCVFGPTRSLAYTALHCHAF